MELDTLGAVAAGWEAALIKNVLGVGPQPQIVGKDRIDGGTRYKAPGDELV
jgi:hypothetical protein